MWLAMVVQGALACSPNSMLYGFADWVDGAVGLPTDGRVVVESGPRHPLTFTRLDTGEVVEGVATAGLPHLQAWYEDLTYAPAIPLAPETSYRADVTGIDGYTYSATFTTGPGPTTTDLASPVLGTLAAPAWESSYGVPCVTSSSMLSRTVAVPVDVPDGLPVGSYIALRSPWSEWLFEHVGLAQDGDLAVVQYEDRAASPEQLALHDCLTPVLILPNGHEIAGAEVCILPPPEPIVEDTAGDTAVDVVAEDTGSPAVGKGWGCESGGGGASLALAMAALGLARRRRG